MIQTIREETEKRKVPRNEVMVVCGGFHVFLDRKDGKKPPAPPPGTVYTTVVPYSFFRISELSGYGAGNRAPQYYQTAWEFDEGKKPRESMIHHLIRVMKAARKEGEHVSSADAIAVAQTADMLAKMRNRSTPTLDDLRDALVTCCCKGDFHEDGHLRKAMDAADIGNKLGRVTSQLTKLPIVNDFYAQMDALEMGWIESREQHAKIDLDKREEKDARRSAFLHRLAYLEIPLGALETKPEIGLASGTLFRETWRLKWSPQLDHALIEQSLSGDTIESAALARLREQLSQERQLAGAACRKLVLATDMDFPDLVAHAEEACGQAIDTDGDFISLGEALTDLLVLDRYAVFRTLRRGGLSDLVQRCFRRACFALPQSASLPEDRHEGLVQALMGLADALQASGRSGSPELDRSLFVEHLKQSAAISGFPFLQGAFWGLLAELREITPARMAELVSAYSRERPEKMVLAGDFLEGCMSVSRTSIMLGAKELVEAIDGLLDAAEWEAFLAMLPKMRAAFERLHERQRDSIAAVVARMHGLSEAEDITKLATSVGAGAMIARIDARVAEIMQEWGL